MPAGHRERGPIYRLLRIRAETTKGRRERVVPYLLMLRTELAELAVHGFQAHCIKLGFEPEMADAALEFEHFEFGVGQHSGEEVGSLGGQRFSGCLTH